VLLLPAAERTHMRRRECPSVATNTNLDLRSPNLHQRRRIRLQLPARFGSNRSRQRLSPIALTIGLHARCSRSPADARLSRPTVLATTSALAAMPNEPLAQPTLMPSIAFSPAQ